jgi:hypothetical protein
MEQIMPEHANNTVATIRSDYTLYWYNGPNDQGAYAVSYDTIEEAERDAAEIETANRASGEWGENAFVGVIDGSSYVYDTHGWIHG